MAVYFPGVPLVPTMSTGATDGIFWRRWASLLRPAGRFGDPDGNGVHGLNERRSVASVYIGRDFLSDLVKDYADR
jgi:acetylornithine deacetylase/succinyl-diaminopimelate desuccinylase-like protein